jgi:hypothetical protein
MSYLQQISLFAHHFNKSPEMLGPEDIRAYQVYLTNEKKLAPRSILTAVAALRFLYKVFQEGQMSSRPHGAGRDTLCYPLMALFQPNT